MRDIAVLLLLAGIVVATFKRPVFGVLGWVLFALLNPHRHTWGFVYFFPSSQVIALATLVALLASKEHRELKGGAPAALLALILLWGIINTPFGFNPERSWEYVDRVFKAYLFVWLALLLMHTRQHVMWLMATIVVSLGFYGVKGGLFTLATAGNFSVVGPPQTMIAGNTEMGTALIITIPLVYYFYQQIEHKWARRGLLVVMSLCAMAAIGTYSRGALVGILGMSFVLWLRSHQKVLLTAALLALVFVAIPFMPERWFDRMGTIQTHEQDASASYRLIAWQAAFNLAKDRFPLGGGFEYESPEVALRYSPDPTLVMVPHSIYFQTLGGLGFIGLAMFLLFWFLVWRQCAWLRKHCKSPSLRWAGQLGSMVQVSLTGYAIGGAFLNLAFWDGVYYIYAAVGVAVYVARKQMAEEAAALRNPAATPAAVGVGPASAGAAVATPARR